MATTYYYTVNSEIVGEHTAGQSRLDYLHDALGSVVAIVDQTPTVKATARYKPYGSDLATTGTVPSPGWVGCTGGYMRTGRPHSEYYIRARHLSVTDGQWTAQDPIWPDQPPFIYCFSAPTTWVDPSGLCPNPDYESPITVEQGGGYGTTLPSGSGPAGGYPNNGLYAGPLDPLAAGIWGLGKSFGEWLAPAPLRKPVWRPSAKANCNSLSQTMHDTCDQKGSGCANKTDCGVLRNNMSTRSLCQELRRQILQECDFGYPPALNWTPKPCGHQQALCQAQASMCTCVSQAQKSNCKPPIGDPQSCAQLRASCQQSFQRCQSYGKTSGPFVPGWWNN